MGVYPLELGKHCPDVLRLWRDEILYAQEPLNSNHPGLIGTEGREVIHPVGIDEKLVVHLVFSELFHTPVELTEDDIGLDDPLSLKVKEKPHGSVSSRMERSPVEDYLRLLLEPLPLSNLKVLKSRAYRVLPFVVHGPLKVVPKDHLVEGREFLLGHPLKGKVLPQREVRIGLPQKGSDEVVVPIILDSKHVVALALRPLSRIPEALNGRETPLCACPHNNSLPLINVVEDVESLIAGNPVLGKGDHPLSNSVFEVLFLLKEILEVNHRMVKE